MDRSESGEDGAFAQAEITELYREDLIYGRRGVMLDNHRSTVTVQDELILKNPSEVYWFAHTQAAVEISEDGKKAYLDRNGKRMLAEIVCGEGAMFSVMPAKPLETSPKCPGQNENEGVTKLTIHLKNISKLQLMVVFNSLDENGKKADDQRVYIPLDKWSINILFEEDDVNV